MRTHVLSLLAAATLSGCDSDTRIDPRDAPALNGSPTVQTAPSHSQSVDFGRARAASVSATVSAVQTDQGRTARFVGSAGLRITPNAGPSAGFSQPTLARLAGGTRFVTASDRPEAAFRVEETGVHVRLFQPTDWALGGVAASASASCSCSPRCRRPPLARPVSRDV